MSPGQAARPAERSSATYSSTVTASQQPTSGPARSTAVQHPAARGLSEGPWLFDRCPRRQFNLWGYIDVRDVALACRLALDAPVEGADNLIIAAADTIMNRSSAELLHEVFPGVALMRDIGTYESLLAIDRAREVLGFVPEHSWHDEIETA